MAEYKSYLEYPHNTIEENTISKFFNRNDALVAGISMIDLMRYDGGIGKKNIDIIYGKYGALDKIIHKDFVHQISNGNKSLIPVDQLGKLPIYNSPTLLIPKDRTKMEFVSLLGKNLLLERTDFNYFFADKLFNLLSDPQYVRSEKLNRSEGRGIDIEVIMENVQVWIWSRALNKIIDVSPFITQLSTDKSDIGSFQMSLNPVQNIDKLVSNDRDNVINYFSLNSTDSGHNTDYFYNNFQYNDLVFIRFEKLQLEKNKKTADYNPDVDRTQLPDQVWDMIGLIDSCSMNQSFQNSSHDISIFGRDLMKLLIEDGSYFMNLALLQGSDQKDLIIGFNKEDKWFKRNIYNGKLGGTVSPYWFPNSARKISDTIGFIINQLSNLGVLGGEDLFSSYGDKRTQKYEVSGINDQYLKTMNIDGIWQIIKLMVDNSVDKRRISDDSLSYVDGSIFEQINKTCQQPFVEFFGDTYGNEFNFVVRQPPFTKDMIASFLQGTRANQTRKWTHRDGQGKVDSYYQIIDIEAKDLQGYNSLQWDTTYYSWYQLNPNDSFLGSFSKLAAGGIIPIIYFEEIAECFGNHRLVISDNYLNANVIEGEESQKDKETYRRALLNDLKYIIDSNIYLPFTRKGSLTLVKGDRRIKKGTFIRVKPTNEIFYVDSVSNNISFSSDKVDRSTTIRVSRGMIEDYIWGANGYDENGKIIVKGDSPVIFSYFDIVNTIIDSSSEVIEEEIIEEEITQGKVGLKEISNSVLYYKRLVKKYFPVEEVDNALRIMDAESGGNPMASNTNYGANTSKGYNGSVDRGLYQINSKAHPEVELSRIFDPEYNIMEAARIFKTSGRGWFEWSTAKIPGVLSDGSVSADPAIKTTYNVTMGTKNLEAFSKLNPAILRSLSDNSIRVFNSSNQGFSSLMVNIENSKLKGDTIEQFIAGIIGESTSSFQKNIDTSKLLYQFLPKIKKSGRSQVFEIDSFVLASNLISTMTGSTVVRIEEEVVAEEKKQQATKRNKVIWNDNFDFSINKEQFNFFLKRKHMNIYKYGRS